MIFDNISNIHIYNLPRVVTDFVSELNSDTKSGRCEICDGIYANIESYNTKLINDAVFEAHENYIDIQILLDGIENIYHCPKENLEVKIPYNKEKARRLIETADKNSREQQAREPTKRLSR